MNNPFADVVISADRIHTMTDDHSPVQALAVRDGVIIAAGSREEISQWTGPATEQHEYPGCTIVPGLTDCHVHVLFGLDLIRGQDLTGLDTMGRVLESLAGHAEGLGTGQWLLGWGLDPNIFEAGAVSGGPFDVFDRPVFLRMRDGHSAVVNARAIQASGITGQERFPGTASIVTGPDGRPTGYLLEEAALERVHAHIPPQSPQDQLQQFRRVLDGMAASGLTGAHALDFGDGTGELLRLAEEQGELPIKLRISPICWPGASPEEIGHIIGLQGTGGARWRVEGVKFFIDGTVDNGTAWLDHPDCYHESTHSLWHRPEDYEQTLRRFVEAGVWTTTHAIGDGGVRFVLDAIERARPEGPHRIEHIETIPDDLVPRFAELGVAASMQPIHGTHHTKADGSDNWSVRLGPERARHGWRCRDLREAGAVVALGSDWPITPYDPRAMMADARLRRPAGRPDIRPVQPEQALSARMALEGYTSHAARSVGAEHTAGSIRPGMVADLTVFGGDPLELDADAAARLAVVATYLDGRPVGRRVSGEMPALEDEFVSRGGTVRA